MIGTAVMVLLGFSRADFSAIDALAEARKFQQQRFANIKTQDEYNKAIGELKAKVDDLVKDVKINEVPPSDCLPLSQLFQMSQKYDSALNSVERFLTTAETNEQHMGEMLALQLSSMSNNIEKLQAHSEKVPLSNSKQALSYGQTWLGRPLSVLMSAKGIDFAYTASKKVKSKVLDLKSLTEADRTLFLVNYGSTISEYLAESGKTKDAISEIDAAMALATSDRDKSGLATAKTRITLVGQPAPMLNLTKGYGKFKQSELKGKVILVDFFAHWCGPCIASFPDLQELVKDLKPKGLEVVGITRYYGYYGPEKNLTPEVEFAKMEGFMKEKGMTWPVMYGDRDNFMNFGCSGIPHVVLIDKKGTVRKIKVGYSSNPKDKASFRAEVESLLAE
jgi:thiol-disulfide isomerase/thioredoxin